MKVQMFVRYRGWVTVVVDAADWARGKKTLRLVDGAGRPTGQTVKWDKLRS